MTLSFAKRFFTAFILLSFLSQTKVLAENMTTIILLNGDPILAEITQEGDFVKEILEVPDYFTSSQSHERLVARSISKAKGLSHVEEEETKESPAMESLCSNKGIPISPMPTAKCMPDVPFPTNSVPGISTIPGDSHSQNFGVVASVKSSYEQIEYSDFYFRINPLYKDTSKKLEHEVVHRIMV